MDDLQARAGQERQVGRGKALLAALVVSVGTPLASGCPAGADARSVVAADASREGQDAGPVEPQGGHSPFGFHGPVGRYQELGDLGAPWSREGIYLVWNWVDPNHDGSLKLKNATLPPNPGAPGSGGTVDFDAERAGVPDEIELVNNICHVQGAAGGGEIDVAADGETYKAFVQKVVERYDGDADLGCIQPAPDCYAPGDGEYPEPQVVERFERNPLKYWQVCNQVTDGCQIDCQATYARKFAAIQKLTYEGVKAADPQAQVLIAGDSARELYPAVFQALAGAHVDIVDFHRFGEEGWYDPKEDFDFLRRELQAAGFDPGKLRFWSTECGTYSGDPINDLVPVGDPRRAGPPYQSELQQARGLLKAYVSALASGVEEIFWAWGIVEGFGCECCIFDYTGLIYDGNIEKESCSLDDPHDKGAGTKKLAYHTYKLMVDELEGSDFAAVETLPAPSGVWLFRFQRSRGPIWVAWSDTAGANVALSGVNSGTVKITKAVPDAASGADLTEADYPSFFTQTTAAVTGGVASVALGEVPVFIEEQ